MEDYHKLANAIKGLGEAEGSGEVKATGANKGIRSLGIIYGWGAEESGSTLGIVESLTYLSQALMKDLPQTKVSLLYVHIGEQGNGEGGVVRDATGESVFNINPEIGGVGGFAKTIHLERPSYIYKTLEIEKQPQAQSYNHTQEHSKQITDNRIAEIILQELRAGAEDIEVSYRGGRRYVRRFKAITSEDIRGAGVELREGGVYWITGGAGGIGLIFADHIVKSGKRAKVILSGRSELSEAKREKIDSLNTEGAEVVYLRGDITDLKDTERLVAEIRGKYGTIHGVIHAAGVIRDSFILKKTREEIGAVLGPKVIGTVNIDEATQGEPLDFFVLFSSISSVMGNIGQSDYAFGNGYMDSYAQAREQFRSKGYRSGKSVSINWPLWEEGGMAIDESTREYMVKTMGINPLSTEAGIAAFWKAIDSGSSEFMIIEGNRRTVRRLWGEERKPLLSVQKPKIEDTEELSAQDQTILQEKTEGYLKGVISKWTKLSVQSINSEESLERYGIDSVMIQNMNRELEKPFGDLSKTLFFEYESIEELTGYFTSNHREKLRELLGIKSSSIEKRLDTEDILDVEMIPELKRSRFMETRSINRIFEDQEKGNAPIAVIGISGRYPMAGDLDTYWENLKAGRDCITEIPKDRWDWRKYYDADKDSIGKSYSKWGGFIDDVDKFDPLFFNISPREAEILDPQERLFLEVVWKTIEDAGYTTR